MIRRSSSGRHRASQRRRLIWARSHVGTTNTALVASAGTSVNLLAAFEASYGAQLLGCTVMRVRGTIAAQNASASFTLNTAVGLQVAADDLTAAQLDPFARLNDDWMYWDTLLANQNIATELAHVDNYKIDVRAKRKIDELGDTLWLGLRNVSTVTSVNLVYAFSVLVALP